MNKYVEALKEVGVFYIATIDGERSRVRPFSSVTEIDGKPYICTNNTKDVYAQLIAHPEIEISGMKNGAWIRIQATAVRDDRDSSREQMLADPTGPSNLYKVGDGIFEVFALENVTGKRYSFTADPEDIA